MNENQNPVRLLNGQYVLLTLINFVVSVSYSMVSTIMAKYLGSIGLSIAVAGAITGAFSIASMVARPFTGIINDRLNRKLLLIGATGGMALCTMLYGLTDVYGVLLAVRFLHGMFFAFSSTVNMAVIPELVPEKRVTEGLSYYGVVQSIGVAVGPSIGLALINMGGYRMNFIASGVLALLGAGAACILRPFSGGRMPCICCCRCGHRHGQRTGKQHDCALRSTAGDCEHWMVLHHLRDRAVRDARPLRKTGGPLRRRFFAVPRAWTDDPRFSDSVARILPVDVCGSFCHQDNRRRSGTPGHSGGLCPGRSA